MSLENLSFEDGGPGAGAAANWTVSQLSSIYSRARYGVQAFDATGAPEPDGQVVLPSWLEIVCPTANRTIQNGAATVKEGFGADAARARSLDGVTFGLAVEKATENLVTEQDLTAWTPSNVTINSATDPAGNSSNVEIDDASGSVGSLSEPFTGYDTVSDSVISSWTQVVGPAPTTGAIIDLDDGSGLQILMPSVDSTWIHRSAVDVAALSSSTLLIQPRRNTGADTGGLRVYGLQLEQGKYPTSFIGADNSTFVRAVEKLTIPSLSLITQAGFFFGEMVIAPHYASTEQLVDHNLLYIDDDNRLYLRQADSKLVLRIGGDDTESAALTFSRNQALTLTIQHDAAGRALTVAGATAGDGTTTADATDPLAGDGEVVVLGGGAGAEESADLQRLEFSVPPGDSETFEILWGNSPYHTTLVGAVDALYSSPPLVIAVAFDSFELWDSSYLRELGQTEAAVYHVTPQTSEDFEQDWGNNDYKQEFAGGDLEAAVYDVGGSANEFETHSAADGWDDTYSTTLGSTETAEYDVPPEDFEDFEEVKDLETFTVDPATNTVLAVGHGYSDDDRLTVESDGQLPPGLNPSPLYWVVSAGANDLQLSLTQGGSAATIDDHGFGEHRLRSDPSRFWTETITV